MLKINLNAYVWVRLSERGKQVYQDVSLGIDTPTRPRTNGGWERWMLWELLRTFGEDTGMGNPTCFVDNCILVDPDQGRCVSEVPRPSDRDLAAERHEFLVELKELFDKHSVSVGSSLHRMAFQGRPAEDGARWFQIVGPRMFSELT